MMINHEEVYINPLLATQFSTVSFPYPEWLEASILKNVSMELAGMERVAIIRTSGSSNHQETPPVL